MSRRLPPPLLFVLCAAAGCADPNPTFVFDAAPSVVTKDGGTDATDGGPDAGDAGDGPDGGTNDAGGEP